MTIERRYSGAFNVVKQDRFGNTVEEVDTVFWTAGTVDEVRRSLIGHDGYDSDIVVIPERAGLLPLTDKELEELCEDNEVRLVQAEEPEVFGMWDWLNEGGNACDQSFATKREAMLDAVERLELEDETFNN